MGGVLFADRISHCLEFAREPNRSHRQPEQQPAQKYQSNCQMQAAYFAL
jgi:hypothetical protein